MGNSQGMRLGEKMEEKVDNTLTYIRSNLFSELSEKFFPSIFPLFEGDLALMMVYSGVKNILVDAVLKGSVKAPVAEPEKPEEKKPNSSAKAAGPASVPLKEIPPRKTTKTS